MKRFRLVLAFALALFATPAIPQSTPSATPTASIAQSVSNTLSNWATANCTPSENCMTTIYNTYTSLNPGSTAAWIAFLAGWTDISGKLVGSGFTCSGDYCGYGSAGSTGDWIVDDNCANWKLQTDASGWLIVPSVPLVGGKPTKLNVSNTFYTSPCNGVCNYAADAPDAILLWRAHLVNQGRDQRDWIGAWLVDNGGTGGSRRASYSSVSRWVNGTRTGHVSDNPYDALASQSTGCCGYYSTYFDSTQVDCPQSGTAVDTDYYPTTGSSSYKYPNCTAYTKNFSLSRSGYAYADNVAIPASSFGQYVSGYQKAAKCVVSKDFIRAVADHFRAAAFPSKNPVTSGQVATGGIDPQAKDLATQPPSQLPAPQANPTAPSTPGATPTPTPSGSTGPDYTDPNIGEPTLDVPDVPTTTWFPAMNLDLGNPDCPAYSFDAFGHHYEMTSHCTFIEQYRAYIGAIMIVLFTIVAVRTVMDA